MFATIDGKVNIRLAVNTKGDQGHLYLAVKAQKFVKWETLTSSMIRK